MRCNDCNKFVSEDDVDAEIDGADVSDNQLTFMVSRKRQCAECSTELKGTEFEFQVDLVVAPGSTDNPCEDDKHEWEGADDLSAENTERSEGSGRGRRQYYGVVVEGTMTCEKCKGTCEVSVQDEIQSSSMDELQ